MDSSINKSGRLVEIHWVHDWQRFMLWLVFWFAVVCLPRCLVVLVTVALLVCHLGFCLLHVAPWWLLLLGFYCETVMVSRVAVMSASSWCYGSDFGNDGVLLMDFVRSPVAWLSAMLSTSTLASPIAVGFASSWYYYYYYCETDFVVLARTWGHRVTLYGSGCYIWCPAPP